MVTSVNTQIMNDCRIEIKLKDYCKVITKVPSRSQKGMFMVASTGFSQDGGKFACIQRQQ